MALSDDRLSDIVRELATKPGHDKVKAAIQELLVDGLGAERRLIRFEQRVPEAQGRIDAIVGRTAFEAKSDLDRELGDAEEQLARYLPERERATKSRFVGIATDGLEWRAYEWLRGLRFPTTSISKPPAAAYARLWPNRASLSASTRWWRDCSVGDNATAALAPVRGVAHHRFTIRISEARKRMARPIQADLFANLEPPQPKGSAVGSDPAGLTPLSPEPPLPPYRPDLDDVRRRLARILGEARAAKTLPWNEDRLAVYRAIVPHMTGWLPEEEGTRLRHAFETELARLEAA